MYNVRQCYMYNVRQCYNVWQCYTYTARMCGNARILLLNSQFCGMEFLSNLRGGLFSCLFSKIGVENFRRF